jgi:hypothetical protein
MGSTERYWLQRGEGPEGPFSRQRILGFIHQGLRVANVAIEGSMAWTPLDRHPRFADAFEAAEPEPKPKPSTKVPASHPDVATFLDRGVRTGPTLGPKMGLVLLATVLLIGLGFMVPFAEPVGALAIPAYLLAVLLLGLVARSGVVSADRRGIGRFGRRRSWDDFEGVESERRSVVRLSRSGRIEDERAVVVTRFHFRGGRDLRVTTDAMTHTRELTRYAEITQAARRDRVPKERLERIRETLASDKPSFAFPLTVFAVFTTLATVLTAGTLYLSLTEEPAVEAPPAPTAPAPAPTPVTPTESGPPSLGALTIDALQRRARAADYRELDLSSGSDGLSLAASAEHQRSSVIIPKRFRLHFFDLDHLPSTGEPPPDDCRLFTDHVVCARGLGSGPLLADLDGTAGVRGLADALVTLS